MTRQTAGVDRPVVWAGLVGALILGVAATTLDWRLLVPIGLGLPLLTVALLGDGGGGTEIGVHRDHQRRVWTTPSVVHRDAWIAGAWVLLFFGSEFMFLAGWRPPHLAASGVLSADNVVELLTYAPAVLTLASTLRNGWPGRVPWYVRVFGLYAAWALISVAWSPYFMLSLARSAQLCVLVAFVAYCACRGTEDPAFIDRVLLLTFRWIAIGVAILGLWGFLTGESFDDRLTWRGQHPNGAGAMLLVAALGMLLHPQRARLAWPLPWWVIPALLIPLSHATGSRASVAAAAVAILAAWVVAGLRDTRVGVWGLGFALITVGGLASFIAERVSTFLYRGQTDDEVFGLNGRIELWQWALNNPIGSEVHGVGYAAVRTGGPMSWDPRHVHSAWIEILQSLGVIGLALLGATVLSLLALIVLRRSVQAAWMATFVAVVSLNSVTIARPGYALILLCLALVAVSVPPPPSDPDAKREASRSRPQLTKSPPHA